MRRFVSLLMFAIGVNVVFATLTYLFFRGHIRNADTAADYFYYAVGSLTTSGTANMVPITDGVKYWTSFYVLAVWVYIVYIAVNHISNIKIGGFG